MLYFVLQQLIYNPMVQRYKMFAEWKVRVLLK